MKNKQLIINILFAIGITFSVVINYTGKNKIVYIDTVRVMKEAKAVKTAGEQYGVKLKEWNAKVDTLSMDLQAMIAAYEKNLSKLSEEERKKTLLKIEKKREEFKEYRSVMNNKARDESEKLSTDLFVQMNELVKEYGEKHNYRIIMGATGQGNMLFSRKHLDITDEFLQYMNSK